MGPVYQRAKMIGEIAKIAIIAGIAKIENQKPNLNQKLTTD
jgi:hypothetical protein